jgi:prepilin-type N-terminal cleavage/methylation domain-containing protein
MNTKSGFTLVELMVVAIIVGILMAVLAPIMLGNKKQAMATEGQTGLGVIRTAMQVYKNEFGKYPDGEMGKTMDQVTGLMVKRGDLDGIYFKTDGYRLTSITASNYILTATGYTNDAAGQTVTLDSGGHWGGTML